ncbi:hypothetical protein C0Q70_19259 [Pomacea canaliculata]|uniref:Major facilitator superfamily (MFS) profile domain-containing protein n=1 Tax=Pomacea canaliculata TaxID=400727 RepID=A0A2T7NIU2_POMCA|nr:hypothetical protein C0Q70_19259 [Pomacea canaliculata]
MVSLSSGEAAQQPAPYPLSKRVLLCLVMVALESFINFEEIYMLAMLQRVQVPTIFVSTPGTFSSAIGVFVIPLIGWASDRFLCCPSLGQKRPFAVLTLFISVVGLCLTLAVNVLTLYTPPTPGNVTTTASLDHVDNQSLFLTLPTVGRYNINDHVPDALPISGSGSTNLSVPLSAEVINSSTYANSTQTIDSSNTNFISALGILGILGFTVADHGYDSSSSTTKAYILAVTPPSQHSSLLVTATLGGAIGGCITSMLGFVELSGIFPSSLGDAILDHGAAQCLVQNVVLLLSVLIFGFCSLATGSEAVQKKKTEHSSLTSATTAPHSETNFSKAEPVAPNVLSESGDQGRPSLLVSSDKQNLSSRSTKKLKRPSSQLETAKSFWKRHRKMVFLCNMTFFSLAANYAYFVYVTNYVAEVIYGGDPYGSSDSSEYALYVEGVHMGSLGMLAFYCLYVVFNIFHDRILKIVKMRSEYLLACIVCGGITLTLAFTSNIVVFFVNAVTFAVFRSVVYTIPFILANSYTHQEVSRACAHVCTTINIQTTQCPILYLPRPR